MVVVERRTIDERPEIAEDEIISLRFLEKLDEAKLTGLTSDPLDLQKLNELFAHRQEAPSYRLVQEVFMNIKRHARTSGDWSLLNLYGQLGREVDLKWFTSERLIKDRRAIMEFLPGTQIAQPVPDPNPNGFMNNQDVKDYLRANGLF